MSKWVDGQFAQGRLNVEVGRQAVCAGSTGCRSGSVCSLRRVNRMSKWVDGQFVEGLDGGPVGRSAAGSSGVRLVSGSDGGGPMVTALHGASLSLRAPGSLGFLGA